MRIEEAFGVVLKKHRINSGLSQEKLAELCDLDRTYISMLERGKRQPTISTIFVIGKMLGVVPELLVGETRKLIV